MRVVSGAVAANEAVCLKQLHRVRARPQWKLTGLALNNKHGLVMSVAKERNPYNVTLLYDNAVTMSFVTPLHPYSFFADSSLLAVVG